MEDFKFLNNKTGLFKKLAELDKSQMSINNLNQFENIFIHRHFSESISNATLDEMAIKLKQNL
jgi:hypothetical protein